MPEGDYEYVVLLGYNTEQEVIEPIGVGTIEGDVVRSSRPINMTSLDYIGYALVDNALNDVMRDVANGETSLLELKAQLRQE
jgi:hypothetical protein